MDLPPEMLPLLAISQTTFMKPKPEIIAYLILNCAFAAVAIAAVAARVYARVRLGAGMGWDDWIVVVTTPFMIALLACQGIMATIGCGYDMVEVILAGNIRSFLVIVMIFQFFSVGGLALVKISTCCFYLRVFPRGVVTWGSWILIGLTVSYLIGFYLAVILLCTPISANWDLVAAATAKCGDQMIMLKAMISINMVLDFAIMVLPLWSVWQLKMRLVDKIGVMACFLIVVVIIVSSIFRLVYITTVDLKANLTGTTGVSVFIGVLEPILSLIAVSLPMLRPLYVSWRKSHGDWSGSYSQSNAKELGNSRPLKLTGDGTSSAPSGTHSRSKPVGSKARSRNEIELDTIFDDAPEKSGSEENLTDTKNGIQVHKKWEVNVE